MPVPQTRPRVRPIVCARVCVWVWARTYPRPNVRVLSTGVDCVRLGSQAFATASAFNADIGAWNTASVTTLSYVCAAFRPGRATAADALGRSSMRHGGSADARARVRTHVYALAWAGVHVCMNGARRNDGIYVCKYIHI
jgi:surface protein